MNWLYYLLEANLYLGIFYLAYHVFLSRETWYTLNRVYLLMSCMVSFILPVIQLGILKPTVHPITAVQYVTIDAPLVLAPVKDTPVAYQFTWQDGVLYGYLLGAAVVLLLLLVKLYQLLKLAQSNKKQPDGSYKLVYLNDTNTAFSFFNWLFIGTRAGVEATIIRHELVHIRQRHSADIIFLELLKIVNWFNPFIYLLQMSLRAVHEYIADEKTATAENDALAYSTFLVNNAYGLSGPPITHSFFNYNLLKKRIIMLNQQRSGNLARLKYLMSVPICAGLVCASTLTFSKNYVLVDLFPQPADTTHIAPPPAPLVQLKLLPPPPPSRPPAKISYLDDGYTSKGYKYTERKYVTGNTVNFWVVIYDKNNKNIFTASSSSPADIQLLSDKYGYSFPPKGRYKIMKASVVKFPPPTVASIKLAPPPPVKTDTLIIPGRQMISSKGDTFKLPPTKAVFVRKVAVKPLPTVHLIAPPPPPAPPNYYAYTAKGYKYSLRKYTIGDKMNYLVTIYENDGTRHLYAANSTPTGERTVLYNKYGYTFPADGKYGAIKFPPPVLVAFAALYDHLSKTLYYPSDAKAKNVYGVVVARFSLDANNKITNVSIINSLGPSCDIAVIKGLSSYTGTISKNNQQYYTVSVSFDLIDAKDNMNLKDFDPKELGSANCALAIPVIGSVKN